MFCKWYLMIIFDVLSTSMSSELQIIDKAMQWEHHSQLSNDTGGNTDAYNKAPQKFSVVATGHRSAVNITWQTHNYDGDAASFSVLGNDDFILKFYSSQSSIDYPLGLTANDSTITSRLLFNFICLRQGYVDVIFNLKTSSAETTRNGTNYTSIDVNHVIVCVMQQSIVKDAFTYVLTTVEFLTLLIFGLSVRRKAILDALRKPVGLLAGIILQTICSPLVG